MGILVIGCGGTIVEREGGSGGRGSVDLAMLVAGVARDRDVEVMELAHGFSTHLGLAFVLELADVIRRRRNYEGVVVTMGTDVLDEVAFALDLLLEPEVGRTVAITGALRAPEMLGADGPRNLLDAILVAESGRFGGLGVVVVMDQRVHAARYVHKEDPQLAPTFRSHSGPIGQLRADEVVVIASALPPCKRYPTVRAEDVDHRVPIWVMVLDPWIDESAFVGCAGIVLATAGCGGLSGAAAEYFAERWAPRVPVVISTRCPIGFRTSASSWKHSAEWFTSRGFWVHEFEGLDATKARLKLVLKLAERQRARQEAAR